MLRPSIKTILTTVLKSSNLVSILVIIGQSMYNALSSNLINLVIYSVYSPLVLQYVEAYSSSHRTDIRMPYLSDKFHLQIE